MRLSVSVNNRATIGSSILRLLIKAPVLHCVPFRPCEPDSHWFGLGGRSSSVHSCGARQKIDNVDPLVPSSVVGLTAGNSSTVSRVSAIGSAFLICSMRRAATFLTKASFVHFLTQSRLRSHASLTRERVFDKCPFPLPPHAVVSFNAGSGSLFLFIISSTPN